MSNIEDASSFVIIPSAPWSAEDDIEMETGAQPNIDYHSARERMERAAAERARLPAARAAHQQLADAHAKLVEQPRKQRR